MAVARTCWWLAAVALIAACEPPQLADVTTRPPDDECPAGGVLIERGADDNEDGTLQTSEVETSELLCSGRNAADALVDATDEAPGANCANGGQRIRVGIDIDGDGLLSDTEVQRVTYVCNADDGVPTLVGVTPEPYGSNCALGGVVVTSGTDQDLDGILDAAEVTSTSYVCTGEVPVNATINGSFYLRNTFDQAVLSHVEHITGTLYVMPNATLPHPTAPKLQDAYGVIVSEKFESLSLPSLTTLSMLDVTQTADFISLDAPLLATTGSVSITPKARLANVNLPALTSVGPFVINGAPLTTLSLDSLTQVGGDLRIQNTQLAALSLPALTTLQERAYVQYHQALATVSMPSLTSAKALELMDLPQLTSLDLRALTSANRFSLVRAPLLSQDQFQIGPVTQVSDALVLSGLPWTDVASFAPITSVGTLHLSALALVTLSGFPNLTSAREVWIGSNASLVDIAGFPQLGPSINSLQLSGNHELAAVSGFPALERIIERLSLDDNGFVELDDFQALTSIGTISIEGNARLTATTGFASLTTIGSIYVTNNPQLTTLGGFASVETLPRLQAIQNAQLAGVAMPALQTALELDLDAPLISMSFPELTSAVVRLANPKLVDVSGVPELRTGGVHITSSTELVTYSLPKLESGGMSVSYAPKLTTIDLPALGTGDISCNSCPSLSSVSAPIARRFGQLYLSSAAITALHFPALESFRSLTVQMVPLLESLDMPALTQIDASGQVFFGLAPRLPACHVTDLLTRTGYTGYSYVSAPPCETIDRCSLQTPENATTSSTMPIDVVGHVRIAGLTDATSGIDASVVQRAQVGRGPRSTSPIDAAWSWNDASPTANWNDAQHVGFDEYRASVTFMPGSFDVAARFSGDGGRSWTYCDRSTGPGSDGSEDGYQISNAGHVEAQ